MYLECEFEYRNGEALCRRCGRTIKTNYSKLRAICAMNTHKQTNLTSKQFTLEQKNPAGPKPGTELKKLLSKIGIQATPNCSCNKRAALMDTNGIEWCENNIDTIVGWLREEASKRKLPFIDAAGKLLVKRAISNARKNKNV